jgi:hypothetical protein
MQRGRMKRGPGDTKHARRERAPEAWWVFVKTRQCFVRVLLGGDFEQMNAFDWTNATVCSGAIEADHMGNRFTQGDGTRAFDWTCVGLCSGHHFERTHVRVARTFSTFTREQVALFCQLGIEWTHAQARALGVEIPNC